HLNMTRKKTLINKIYKKKQDKKCYFCPCDDYDLLDVHRINEGSNGGRYTEFNTVVVCSLCHRKIHSGKIKVFRKYFSTKGWVLHYLDENNVEHFD
ncbi:MAG: HNH endonuclease, partial [bacterium]